MREAEGHGIRAAGIGCSARWIAGTQPLLHDPLADGLEGTGGWRGWDEEAKAPDREQGQLELAWEEQIGWKELPAQIRSQIRDELKRLLMQFAVGAEVVDDDAEH